MKKQEETERLLDKAAALIIGYEAGDVMKVCETAEIMESIKAGFEKGGTGERLCTRILEELQKGMADSYSDFTGAVTEGIDLLRSVTGGNVTAGRKEQITAWLADRQRGEEKGTAAVSPGGVPPAVEEGEEDGAGELDGEQKQQFVSDCTDRLTRAQDLILKLEEEREDGESVKELFRIFHTIKGECGFLKLTRLGNLAHRAEGLLDGIRSGKQRVDGDVTDMLLSGLDSAEGLVKALKEGDIRAYNEVPVESFSGKAGGGTEKPAVPDAEDVHRMREGESAAPVTGRQKDGEADTVIKVKTGKVTYLTDMIGELLISLGQMKDGTEGLAQVKKIAGQLQYAGMQLRTESVHALFSTVRRIIRDTSKKVGKDVEAEFRGEDLEIDRTLTERLEEPLMHLVRNALDHGIESREERSQAGKKASGTVRVAAERRGNSIVISVGDDGRGLDREKILRKAVEKKLVSESGAADMSDSAVHSLIFVSGFSTNEKVDQISGRGVGMDIVKEAVEEAKGHITIESAEGKGTTFYLHFPLSTAIVDGMLTRTGKNILIVPAASVLESLKVKEGQIRKVAAGTDVLNLRGRMLPVIGIADVFGIEGAGKGEIATVVEDSSGEEYALLSDEVMAKREVVIKSLGAYFRKMKGISSGTVLPGGEVGFVLDVDEVVELGRAGSFIPGVLHG
jgi:two-component system, chemotaxis family, sensor kinase CheA